MSFWKIITQTSSNLRVNKLRSFLTLFGITCGIASVVFLGAFLLFGCSRDKEEAGEIWERVRVLDFGQRPMPSPDGTMLAFATEETASHSAGIYLLDADSVVQLTAGAPPHSWDYVWAPDGTRLAFSAPGEPGTETAGIWVIEIETRELEQVWDRGSAPSWDPNDSDLLYCAGPEDGTDNEGIFAINLVPSARVRLLEAGTTPRMSPDRQYLAYQVAGAGSQGRELHVLTRDGLVDTVAAYHAGSFSWAWDSRLIIYEFVGDGSLDIYSVLASRPLSPNFLVSAASLPAPFPGDDRVAFAKLSGASLAGIWTVAATGGIAVRLTSTGTHPQPTTDGGAIYFDDDDGIYVLTRIR
jgi:ABC-type antimicrobial peptide transport system permease subunit